MGEEGKEEDEKKEDILLGKRSMKKKKNKMKISRKERRGILRQKKQTIRMSPSHRYLRSECPCHSLLLVSLKWLFRTVLSFSK